MRSEQSVSVFSILRGIIHEKMEEMSAASLAVTVIGAVGRNGIYEEYAKDWPRYPVAASVFWGIADGKYPWTRPVRQEAPPEDTQIMEAINLSSDTELLKEDTETEQDENKTYEFTHVEEDYFDDAVFIGDSRMVGLHDYSGWDHTTYYASIGLTIYDLFDSPIVEEDGKKITVEEALGKHRFNKIFLMVGINEMGTGTVDSFMKVYEEAVRHLRQLQPEAIIFVQGIMYVKQEKSQTDPIFNNPNIQERNDRIAKLADNRDIFYLDINEVVTDETGNLNPEYTYDEIHLLGKYYSIWTDFLKEHGIVKEERSNGS